ncbi:Pao retrotransposon peptidase family protein, partial [Aphelenchoides avenae]
ELPIQKFGGDNRTYPLFRNRFLKMVGTREDLEPIEKFQYLLQYLEGEPLRIANGYLLNEANYFKVLDRLHERYHDPSYLAVILTQDFVSLKAVSQTSRDLHRFHDEALRLTDQMEQAGNDANNNIVLRETLLSKMPLALRTKVFEKLNKDPATTTIREILKCVSDHARLLERSERQLNWNTADGNSGSGGRQCRPDPRSTSYRAGTFVTDAEATHAAHIARRICSYCGRDHWALKCNVYITITQRMRRLQQLGFCFLCLRGGHRSGECPKRTNEPCRFCHAAYHHQSICRKAVPARRTQLAPSHQNPVRATPSGTIGILKKEPTGGSSSQQYAQGSTPVTWAGVNGMPTATQSCPPSAQISSTTGESNSKQDQRKKSKGKRTGPNGRNGTTRPTTAFVDENAIQMDAKACGGDGILPVHQGHLMTDRRSTPAEAQWYDRTIGDGSGGMIGSPDGYRNHGLLDEEASLPDSTGHCSDADSEPPAEEQWAEDPSWFGLNEMQDYSGYAISTTSPADNNAVLLECLKTTAVNVNNGLTRPAIVFFDSGSNISYIGMRLARELQLPYLEKRLMRVNTFGTDVVTTVEGFATTVLLRSPQGASVALTLTASDRIVPPVTTALVADDEVQLLKKNKCALISTREKPDLLIGQDLFHLFERRFGPQLPNGFHVTWTCLGPVAGGAGK